jgi:hypothetical protein
MFIFKLKTNYIGGVFTVAGILDAMLFRVHNYRVKARLNKVS